MTKLTLIASPIRCGSPTHTAGAVIALGVALVAAPTAALAEAQVRGSPEAVTIEAKNTSVEEILKALSGAFDVHYRSSANLQMRVTGNYEGSLHRVMKRVLDGYSYFVKSGDGRIDVTVLDAPRTAEATGASPPFRVVGAPADAVPQPPPAIAAVERSVTSASPAAPSTGAPSSSAIAGPPPYPPPQAEGKSIYPPPLAAEGRTAAPAQPSPPTIAVVQPPGPPAAPAAPSSRRRDQLLVAGGTESRPSPPRRIKTASSHQWKKSKHHVRRTRLARSAIVCSRRIRSFGAPMIPVSSYYWHAREPLYLRSVANCAPRRHARIQKD